MRRDQPPGVVAHRCGDAAYAGFRFLVVGRPALALDALELALELRHRGDRIFRERAQSGAARVVAKPGEAVFQQEELAGGGDVQRRARAHHVHHAHRRAPRRGALDVDDLVIVAHGEVHGFARLRVQLAHHR